MIIMIIVQKKIVHSYRIVLQSFSFILQGHSVTVSKEVTLYKDKCLEEAVHL